MYYRRPATKSEFMSYRPFASLRHLAVALLAVLAVLASTLVIAAPLPAELGLFLNPAAAQSGGGSCPPNSTFLTEFNWSSAPGGSDNPAGADGATWPANTTNKSWTNVGGSGLDVTIGLTGTVIDGNNGGTVGPGAVGTIDGFPTGTNEGGTQGGNDGAYGSDYFTLAMYSESSDAPVEMSFDFSRPVFFASDFTVDDVDWIGHLSNNPIPANGFQDEVAFTATGPTGDVPVGLAIVSQTNQNFITITGQSAKADPYDQNGGTNLQPTDPAGQVLISTPKPFTNLTIDYSNGPEDQAAEIADANNPGTWDGVSNGHAVRLGGFTLCEPFDASLTLDKTAYLGHDSGAACTGADLVTGAIPGEAITYCFDVTNTGQVALDTFSITDAALGLTNAVPPEVQVVSGTTPVAPGATISFYYEASAPLTDLVNSATAEAIPVDAAGDPITFLDPVTHTDTATVETMSPAVSLTKDVVLGHQSGANCGSATDSAAIVSGTAVTYCFTVTNTGDLPLANIDIQDATLGSPAITQTVAPVALPLAPGASVVYYFEATATGTLTNTAAVSADPTNPDGSPVPGATPVTDSDTAVVTEEAPAIELQKSASTDGTCPGGELVNQINGATLSYCFEVSNTGTTHLANVSIADADISGFNPANLVPVTGSLALIAPAETVVVRYDTTATVDVIPNTATATGDPADPAGDSLGLNAVSDDDTAAVDVVAPSISLVKTVVPAGSTCPGIDATTLVVATGSSVIYCFTVTNTGDTDLTGVVVDDPGLGIAGLAVADLAVGAAATVAAPSSVATDTTNIATATGTPANGTTPLAGIAAVSDTEEAIVDVVTPAVALDKTVVGGSDVTLCPGSETLAAGFGVAITYCFAVTNTGQTHLDMGNFAFNDATLGITAADLVPVGAPTDPLAPGGTNTYAFTTTMDVTETNTADIAADPVDAAGNPISGASPVTDNDIADVVLASPAIGIVKTAYAGTDGGASCPGTDTTTVEAGAAITYCFVVTNTSTDTALANVTIDDTTLGETYPGNITLLAGNPALLQTGEAATFYLDATATGDITNTAEATGAPSDASGNPVAAPAPTASDPTTVDVTAPAIELAKTVYPGHDAGASCSGTEIVNGIAAAAVTYCFTVTNTGDTALSGVSVSDPALGISLPIPGVLLVGDSVTVFSESTITGDLTNTATTSGVPSTAAGTPLGLTNPTDVDDAQVNEIAPSVSIDKTIYVGSDAGASCGSATNSALTVAGSTVTYCFLVTNTGDTYLSDLTIDDPTLGVSIGSANEAAVSGTLATIAPGASAVVYLEVVAGATDVANIASVTGNPTNAIGADLTGAPDPTDTDDALMNVLAPSVEIAKTVSVDGTCPGVETVSLQPGTAVSFCFALTNTGDTYLADLTIDDDIYGVLDSASTSAVAGSLALVAPSETIVVRYDTTSPAADQVNTASTTGTLSNSAGSPLGIGDVTSPDDTAEILVIGPGLTLTKTAVAAGAACTGVDGATLEVAAGTDVTYCFEVTNTGDTYLTDVTVDDPTLGVTGLAVADLPANGDSNVVSFGPVAATNVVNTAQAIATAADPTGTPLPGVPSVDDTDPAQVDVLTPAITLEKTVVPGSNVNDCPGAELVNAQNGVAVVYCFVVTNTGDAPLANISVTDPDLAFGATDPTLVSGTIPLAPGASATYGFATTITGDLVNTANVSGDPLTSGGAPLPGAGPVSDTDTAEVTEAEASLSLVKTVYAGHDAGTSCGGTNSYSGLVGDAVTYCFVVTNTSATTTMSSTSVDDPNLNPITLVASGATTLAPGESVVFYAEDNLTADLVNIATASGIPSAADGTPLPDATAIDSPPDTATVDVNAPAIALSKTVYAGHDAGASCAGAELASGLVGAAITYCFEVTNTGDIDLTDISVNDPTLGINLAVPGPIAPGNSATVIFESTITSNLVNTATTSGTPSTPAGAPLPGQPPVVSAPDDAEVVTVDPAITFDKSVYAGHDAGASCSGSAQISGLAGDLATYCFEVTNTGDTALAIEIDDATLGLDASNPPTVVSAPASSPLLGAGESIVYFAQTVLSGDLVNTATATATPVDPSGDPLPGVPSIDETDSAIVDVVDPAIQVDKTVSSTGSCPGTELVSGNLGDPVIYCFTVTNTGDTALATVSLNDTTLGITDADMVLTSGSLALLTVGESATLQFASTITGDLLNTVTATGTPSSPGGAPLGLADVADDDTAEVDAIAPDVTLVKTVSVDGTCAGQASALVGSAAPIIYCFEVTNSGDTHLSGLTLTDPTLGLSLSDPTVLAPSESIMLSAPATATLDVVNIASVAATPSAPGGAPLADVDPVADTDQATVDVVSPSIELTKTVTAGTSCPGLGQLTGGEGVALTYCFEVTNNGTTHLDLSTMVFDDPTLGITAADLTTVTSASSPLAPGDSAMFSYSGATIPAGGQLNTATVAADPVDATGVPIAGPSGPLGPVDDLDTAEVLEAETAIALTKTVYVGNDGGSNCPGINDAVVEVGDSLTYCFVVTNTSATASLANVTIDDTTLGETYPGNITLLTGDPTLLAPGESAILYLDATASGDQTNTASTTGEPADAAGTALPSLTDPTASDTALVTTAAPGITIDKTVYEGHNAGALCGTASADDLAYGVAGQPATYCFTVTNTGDTHLSGITVADPTLGITLSDPALLAPGASVTVFAESTISSDLVNSATATGLPTDPSGTPFADLDAPLSAPDDAEVVVVTPDLTLEKSVYAGAHDGGARCATAATELASGLSSEPATWCFTVTNSGDVDMASVEISDPLLGLDASTTLLVVAGTMPLAPGDTITYAFEGTIDSDLTNVATAVGSPLDPNGNPLPDTVSDPTDLDGAQIELIDPQIELVKTVSVDATCPGASSAYGENGDGLTYCFAVTNTGDTELVNVTLDDSPLGITDADMTVVSGSLSQIPAGETVVLSYDTTLAGNLENIATTEGQPGDGSGAPLPDVDPVIAAAQANVYESAPQISLTKTASTSGVCPGSGRVETSVDAPITWCLTVANTGDTHLSNLVLIDAQLGLDGTNQSVLLTPDPAGVILAPVTDPSAFTGETITFAITATADADTTNSAQVSASAVAPDGSPLPGSVENVAAPDTAEIDVLTPAIELEKTVSANGTCPGADTLAAGAGFGVTYCFVITNTGETPLDALTIDDADLGVTTSDLTLVGIADDDDALPLSVGGTATYSVEATVTTDLVNTATATGAPLTSSGDPLPGPDGNPTPPVESTDIATVVAADSAIAIIKTAYVGHDAGANCPGVATTSVDSGADITYCFNVVNTDPTNHLADITIDDPSLAASFPGDLVLLSGDPTDLAPGETATFFYETTATGDLVNTASTTGTPTDPSGTPLPGVEPPTDEGSATIDVVGPAIDITKAGYLAQDQGAQCPGTDPIVGVTGTAMTWCFFVTNTGDTALSDVTVTDPDLGITLTEPGVLLPGASVTLWHEATLDQEYTNTAQATGVPSSPNAIPLANVSAPTATDTAVVDLVAPQIFVEKALYEGNDGGAGCPGENQIVADHGVDVTWCFRVSNIGDTYLSDIEIEDEPLGLTTEDFTVASGSTPLAPREAIYYFAVTEVDDSMINDVLVTATPYADPAGTPIPVTEPVEETDTAILERTPFDLEIIKTLDSVDASRRTARWKLVVTNNGPGTAAGPLTVTDPLPSQLGFVDTSSTAFSCGASGQLVRCVSPGDLAVDQSIELFVDTSISSSASGTINNAATVSSPLSTDALLGETTLDNNESAAPVEIGPSGNPQVAFTGSSTDVLVQIALILITIGALFMGIMASRRRRDS